MQEAMSKERFIQEYLLRFEFAPHAVEEAIRRASIAYEAIMRSLDKKTEDTRTGLIEW